MLAMASCARPALAMAHGRRVNYAFLPLLAFATRQCELEASNFNFLPQLAFELAVAS